VIRVFIVAASSFARAALQSLITSLGMEVAGQAANVDSLGGHWLDLEADVLMVEAHGEQFEAVIDSLGSSQISSESVIVLLSDRVEQRALTDALRTGVRAVLPSDISPKQLAASLEAAAAGLVVMLPTEVESIFPAGESGPRPLQEPLTRRENEVLQMLAAGLGNKEIATKCGISEHTVKFHVTSILGKLGAASRTEAVTLGIRHGIVLL
jgi:NarL family two-component system response regulator YdfI